MLSWQDSTGLTLWSRRGNRFTDRFPTIAKACEHLPPDTLLDGEIIALDQNGRISFNMLQHHRSQAQAILFYPFDVIIHRGRRLIHVPLETRRELLSDIAADLKTRTPLIGLSDTLDSTPAELIPLVKESASRASSLSVKTCYESGKRSGTWLKYKVNKAQAFVIGGYTPGNPLDAVIIGYYEGEKLIYAAKVRNGFVPRLRRDVWEKLKG